MAESGNVANTRRTSWDVSTGGTALGYMDMIDPTALAILTEAIRVGSLGKADLGGRVIGLNGLLKFQLRECLRANIAALCTWPARATATGELLLSPAAGVDDYTYAVPLLFHPRDLAGNVVGEDLELFKCVPTRLLLPKRDGGSDDVIDVDMKLYPDRSLFPLLVYGRIKPAA